MPRGFPLNDFRAFLGSLQSDLQDENGLWKLRGFIDTASRIYPLSADTKVISKALELMILPGLTRFFEERAFRVILAEEQNHYPDISVVKGKSKWAIELKSTYRNPRNPKLVSGFTLGAFTGYFRDRTSTKNITFPYAEYQEHYVLGIIYTRNEEAELCPVYQYCDLRRIPPPIHDLVLFFQPKWRIASDSPGSGNTTNIGSVKRVNELVNGNGLFFARFGERGREVFDLYWQEYLTTNMARRAELARPPFRNLDEFIRYRRINLGGHK
ncbi:MAG: type II restriction endonuclease [candidate division WOR-3 bacterium]